MIRVAHFSNLHTAERTAAWLRSKGVAAQVVGHHVTQGLGVPTSRLFPVEVVVADRDALERALELLAACPEHDTPPSPGWESGAVPDLSRLDPVEFIVHCAACGQALPLDAHTRRCPACRADADIPELLVARFGPEALEGCYEPWDGEIPPPPRPDFMTVHARRCPDCGYSLAGLSASGRCPECGRLYAMPSASQR